MIDLFIYIILAFLFCFMAIFYLVKPLEAVFIIFLLRITSENFLIKIYPQYSTILLGLFSLFIIYFTIIFFLQRGKFECNIFQINFLYIFIFVNLLSFVQHGFDLNGLGIIFKYITMLIIFIIPFNIIKSYEDVVKSLNYFAYISLVPLSVGIYQFVTSTGSHYTNYWGQSFHYIYSTFAHKNNYGFFLSVFFIILLILIQERKDKNKFYLILLPVVIISILLTFSKSTWIVIIFISFVYCLFYKNIRYFFLLLGILVPLIFSSQIVNGLADILYKENAQRNSIDFRTNININLLKYAFPEKPLLGHGPGSADGLIERYAFYKKIPPHNDYLRILVENGIFGFLSFFIFLSSNLFIFYKNKYSFRDNNFLVGNLLLFVLLIPVLLTSNIIHGVSTFGSWFLLFGIFTRAIIIRQSSYKITYEV